MAFQDDDLDLLFAADAPDISSATFTVSSVASTVYGYFNRPGAALDLDNGRIITTEPTFEIQTSDVTSFNKESDTITISAVAYNVLRWQASVDGRTTIYFLGRD